MAGEEGGGTDQPPDDRRRRLLGYAALAMLAGSGVTGAWYVTRPDGRSEPMLTDTPAGTDDSGGEDGTDGEVPALVSRYAPDLYFGAAEKWYPTDPRQYVEGSVVDGFKALDEYSAAFAATGTSPAPTVFYNVAEAADGIDAIQYWFYSVFDQFTVNFHWHDWELLQVFVDRETGSPLLLSASAHSRKVPNNEFLEPGVSGDHRPGILAEVGSHSSASDVNDVVASFERVVGDDWTSDVTNDFLDVTQDVTAPFAYGLPRGEGARLPFVMPELDGTWLDQHPSLSVDREAFIDERLTVGSWHGLTQPPADLPLRKPGLVLAHPDSSTDADVTYALEPIEEVQNVVEDFAGEQLSFEFAIPGFLEDQFAGYITSVGIPWEQDRFTDPLDDVTDPAHRQRIDGTTPSGLVNRVVGRVRHLRNEADGALGRVTDEAREALGNAVSVSIYSLPVEVVVRLASDDPVATVTRSGVFGYLHVEPGEHLLVVNGPGIAPLAESFVHEGGLLRAGSGGDLTVVSTEDAAWIRGDGRDTTGIDRVRVVEDYAGVVYDGRPVEEDRFAVAVHRDGRYTVEIVDSNGRPGAYRVGPEAFGDDRETVREAVETGKAALARTLFDELGELRDLTRMLAERDDANREVIQMVITAREEAEAAISAAEDGEVRPANDRLSRARSFLEEAVEILRSDRQGGYSDASVAAIVPRVQAAIERVETAIETSVSTR